MPTTDDLRSLLSAQAIRVEPIQKKLSTMNFKELLSFCKKEPLLAQKLVQPDLERFWNHYLEKFQPLPNNKLFRLQPQNYIFSGDLVLGMIFYSLYQKDSRFLSDALRHHSFHTYYVFLHQQTQLLLDKELDIDEFSEKQQLLCHFIEEEKPALYRHEAPGLLLLALSYFLIAIAAGNQKQQSISEVCMCEALKYAYAAKQMEDCESSYHNAYFDIGFKMSNPLGLDSLDKLIDKLNEKAEEFLDKEQQLTSISKASQFLRSLKLKRRNVLEKGSYTYFFRHHSQGEQTTSIELPKSLKK